MTPGGGPVQPRLMTKAEAAAYCRVTPDGFGKWVRSKIVPGPIPGTKRWDRIALDAALDRASGIARPEPAETPLER